MNKVKKVAAIHDISGLGRCSLTVAIPILSILGIQVCPFPTAVLSCQTGYSKFSFLDLTSEMNRYRENWEDMEFKFQGIYSGFLGGIEQIEIIMAFIKQQEDSLVVVDPVMGDNGEVYKTFSAEMCDKMKELVKVSNVVTPNLTEACILTDEIYRENDVTDDYLMNIGRKLTDLGPDKVVITGIKKDDLMCNYGFDKKRQEHFIISNKRVNVSFSGTGDIFASIVCGMLINGYEFKYTVEKAADFISKAISYSEDSINDPKNGVAFEPLLGELLKI